MTIVSKLDAAQIIATTIADFAMEKTLILLSGGSSANIGVDALKQVIPELRTNCIVLLADERYVQYGSSDSNATLLKSFGLSGVSGKFVETLQPSLVGLQETAQLFETNLKAALSECSHCVAVLGIGADNHTAGILPNSIAAQSDNEFVVAYQTDVFERITIAPRFFEKIDVAFAYVAGEDKLPAVATIDGQYDTVSHPSQLIKKTKQWTLLFNKENV